MTSSLKYIQPVNAPISQLFRAFTNATALREWLCDIATVEPKPGGRFYIAWYNGYTVCGEFNFIEPMHRVCWTWYGRNEPAPTRVEITLQSSGEGSTLLTLEHLGLGNTAIWEKPREEMARGWNNALRNLVSVLEQGPDLRIINRPMLGVSFGEFDARRAALLGVPVETGMRVEGVFEGFSAQKAGLMKNDVLITLGGQPCNDFPSVLRILESYQAGDSLEVVFYRGAEKKQLLLELSQRPLPKIPSTSQALSQAVQSLYAYAHNMLEDVLQGVSESEAEFKPAREEWSIKEVIAHLIHVERDTQAYINDVVFSQERVSDGYSDNLNARVAATAHVFQTTSHLLEELKRAEDETISLLHELPENFVANKGSFWRLAFQLLQLEFPAHTQEHVDQMRANLEAARAG